jgi:hypothetical protein
VVCITSTIWDGDISLWEDWKQSALTYMETMRRDHRYLCGPRLVAELRGSAKSAVANKKAGWVSSEKGLTKLINFLEKNLARPALPEVGQQLQRFIYGTRRKKGEPMGAFCTRHHEQHDKAKKALAKAIQQELLRKKEQGGSAPASNSAGAPHHAPSVAPSEAPEPAEAGDADGGEGDGDEAEPAWVDSRGWDWEDTGGWNWRSSWNKSSWKDEVSDSEDSDNGDGKETFLPEFLVAWLLRHKTSLDAQEKGLILSDIKGRYEVTTIEEALKTHWPDEDLRKREIRRRAET